MEAWEHDLAISIHAFYVGEREAGQRSCERGLAMEIPWVIENNFRSNLAFYAPVLSSLFSVTYISLNESNRKPGWSLFNPTIIRHGEKHIVLIRSSNYKIIDGRYDIQDSSHVIRTEYQYAEFYDGEIRYRGCISQPSYDKTNYPVDGMEDLRLLSHNGGLLVSGTIRNCAPYDGTARIGIAKLDPVNLDLHSMKVFESVSEGRHEKNWMPIEGDGTSWVYSCHDDGAVSKVVYNGQSIEKFKMGPSPVISRSFRGGSQLIKWEDGYLCVTHEVAHFHDGRCYLHRFIKLDNELKITAWSDAFFFKESGSIEFASGISMDGDDLLVAFGVMDKEAYLLKIKCKDVKWYLNHLA